MKRRTASETPGLTAGSNNPTIPCPRCGEAIRLTETLAAPLVATLRSQYEKKLRSQDRELAARERAMEQRAEELERSRKTLEAEVGERVQARLRQERHILEAEAARQAREQLGEELEQRARDMQARDARIGQLQEKLNSAQAAEAELLRKERELDDARRELTLQVERGIQEGLEQVRAQARSQAEEATELSLRDRDHMIRDLREQIGELKRRAEQGSQQAQGEVLELLLEEELRRRFPGDEIEPVGKGEAGADVLQHVHDESGHFCGKILWETKRTRHWQAGWLAKLRADQREAEADFAVIASRALPEGMTHFDYVEGIWITGLSCRMPVAVALRQAILELARIRRLSEGQETKVQQVYAWLTGPRFRQRVEVIVEKFADMREDLDRERRVITRQWAKREQQIRAVIDATAGMYGDLEGIAGRSLGEIEALGSGLLLTDRSSPS